MTKNNHNTHNKEKSDFFRHSPVIQSSISSHEISHTNETNMNFDLSLLECEFQFLLDFHSATHEKSIIEDHDFSRSDDDLILVQRKAHKSPETSELDPNLLQQLCDKDSDNKDLFDKGNSEKTNFYTDGGIVEIGVKNMSKNINTFENEIKDTPEAGKPIRKNKNWKRDAKRAAQKLNRIKRIEHCKKMAAAHREKQRLTKEELLNSQNFLITPPNTIEVSETAITELVRKVREVQSRTNMHDDIDEDQFLAENIKHISNDIRVISMPESSSNETLISVTSSERSRYSEIEESELDKFSLCIKKYENALLDTCERICIICNCLFFKSNTRKISKSINEFIGSISFQPVTTSSYVCLTCASSSTKNILHKMSICKSEAYAPTNETISSLNELEAQLLAPRIPFFTIRNKTTIGGQYLLLGNIFNVPVDINNNAYFLRELTSSNFFVKLKRKIEFENAYIEGYVDPRKLVSAAKYLNKTPLYIDQKIKINVKSLEDIVNKISGRNLPSNDNFTSPNIEAVTNFQQPSIDIAPAEGLPYRRHFSDPVGEELAFPTIYYGQAFPKNDISYNARCRSELRRADRRCQLNHKKIFFMFQKATTFKINSAINICVRKNSCENEHNASFYRDHRNLETLVQENDAYAFLSELRHSPHYWKRRKDELLHMIKTLGPPTFFITLSPEEYDCEELLNCLISNNDKYKDRDIKKMTKKQREEIIAADPIMSARFFNHKARRIFSDIILNKNGIFREHPVEDYFIRTEFQTRGSPHLHCFLWCKNFVLDQMTALEIEHYASEYITAYTPPNFKIHDSYSKKDISMKTQIHRHMRNCKFTNEFGYTDCDKGYPKPILEKNEFIFPFNGSNDERIELRSLYNRIKRYVQERYLSTKRKCTLLDILERFEITYITYRSSLSTINKYPTFYTARTIHDVFTNNYNEKIFLRHRANMDIQLVTDPYLSALYITSYMMKSQKDINDSLEAAIKEYSAADISLKSQLVKISESFLNATRISAQECAYHLLAMPLTSCSRRFLYINTLPRDQRARLLKRDAELKKLSDHSTDVFQQNIFFYYENRPLLAENMCLAEFGMFYAYQKMNNIPEESTDDVFVYYLPDKFICLKKRKKPKILQFHRFNKKTHFDEYIRVLLLLYTPWRNELVETSPDLFKEKEHSIRKNIDKCNILDEKKLDQLSLYVEEYQKRIEKTALEKHHKSDTDTFAQNNDDEVALNNSLFINEMHAEFVRNIVGYMGENDKLESEEQTIFAYDTFTLNDEQSRYQEIFIRCYKSGEPFYHLILGGAGTGKSHLIHALCSTFDQKKEQPSHKIIKTAFTGKAAFNIKGYTLHGLFHIPTQFKVLPDLSESVLDADKEKWKNIKVLILDEISMVSSTLLKAVNTRLQQLLGNTETFGGISIIALGDLNQLSPVMGKYIFNSDDPDVIQAWRLFKLFQLTEIMRQRDDLIFAQVLNRIGDYGINSLSREQIRLLNTRITALQDIPHSAIFLCASNKEVQEHNERKITSIPGEEYLFTAIDVVIGDDADSHIAANALSAVKRHDLSKTCSLPTNIRFKLGIKYMITLNLNIEDGLVNGAVGTLKCLGYDQNGVITRIWLDFNDSYVGRKFKRTSDYACEKEKDGVKNDSWVYIRTQSQRIYRNKDKKDITITRVQFPVIECEAMTIHKAQGQTYNSVAVNITENLKKSMLYVAISRATKLEGLYLYGNTSILPQNVRHVPEKRRIANSMNKAKSDAISKEIERLQRNKLQ